MPITQHVPIDILHNGHVLITKGTQSEFLTNSIQAQDIQTVSVYYYVIALIGKVFLLEEKVPVQITVKQCLQVSAHLKCNKGCYQMVLGHFSGKGNVLNFENLCK